MNTDTLRMKDTGAASAPVVPRFASVEVVPVLHAPITSPQEPKQAAPSVPAGFVGLSLRLPSGVALEVTGFDADAATLLVLEMIGSSSVGSGMGTAPDVPGASCSR